jgi:hypothetical protein
MSHGAPPEINWLHGVWLGIESNHPSLRANFQKSVNKLSVFAGWRTLNGECSQ